MRTMASLVLTGLCISNACFAQQGYGFLKLGISQVPEENYNSPETVMAGAGNRFHQHSVEFALLGFDDFQVNQNTKSYIELKAARIDYNYHIDFGKPELSIGLNTTYYDAKAYHAATELGGKTDFTFGIGAGLNLPITHEYKVTMDLDLTNDVLGENLTQFTLGIQKDFL